MEYKGYELKDDKWIMPSSACALCVDMKSQANEQLNFNLENVKSSRKSLEFILVSTGVSLLLVASASVYSSGGSVNSSGHQWIFPDSSRSAIVPVSGNQYVFLLDKKIEYPFITIDRVINRAENEYDAFIKMAPKRIYSIELIIDKVYRATPKIVID